MIVDISNMTDKKVPLQVIKEDLIEKSVEIK